MMLIQRTCLGIRCRAGVMSVVECMGTVRRTCADISTVKRSHALDVVEASCVARALASTSERPPPPQVRSSPESRNGPWYESACSRD